jgi:hypothetical protein
MSQVSRNVMDASDGFVIGKRYLIHSRDPRFTVPFRETLAAVDVRVVRLPLRSPNLNSYAQRLHGPSRNHAWTESFSLGKARSRRAVGEFIEHCHHERNHQGLSNQLIVPVVAQTRGGDRVASR